MLRHECEPKKPLSTESNQFFSLRKTLFLSHTYIPNTKLLRLNVQRRSLTATQLNKQDRTTLQHSKVALATIKVTLAPEWSLFLTHLTKISWLFSIVCSHKTTFHPLGRIRLFLFPFIAERARGIVGHLLKVRNEMKP